MMSSNSNTQPKTQGFKKKTSNLGIDTSNLKQNDKLGDLKSKLQKEKEMMRKTGKRFRQDNSISTQQISISTDRIADLPGEPSSSKHDISIGSQQPIKQTISLKDLSINGGSTKEDLMKSSQLFEREKKQQKKRSDEVYRFLKGIELEGFAQRLIMNGFDDLESLAQLTSEDLNHVMMRAQQQVQLLEALKSLKIKLGTETKQVHKEEMSNTSTLFRMKTERMESTKTPQFHSSQIITRLKTEQNGRKQGDASCIGLKPGSFLFTVGSRNWSVEDQVRRACSVCYKVEPQMQKKGQCFYCSNCYKFVSGDLLHISLGKSMNREYTKKKEEEQ